MEGLAGPGPERLAAMDVLLMTDAHDADALWGAYRWFKVLYRDHGIAQRLARVAQQVWSGERAG